MSERFYSQYSFGTLFVRDTTQNSIYYFLFCLIMSLFFFLSFPSCLAPIISVVKRWQEGEKEGLKKNHRIIYQQESSLNAL